MNAVSHHRWLIGVMCFMTVFWCVDAAASAGHWEQRDPKVRKKGKGNEKNSDRGSKKQGGRADKSLAARQKARNAIRSGKFESAESLIRKAAKIKHKAERDAWAIVSAELEHAKKNYAKAGLVAMRLVILRPKSAQVGAALYWVGRAYEGLGRPHKSIELYEACIEHKTTKRKTLQRAEKKLARLKERLEAP